MYQSLTGNDYIILILNFNKINMCGVGISSLCTASFNANSIPAIILNFLILKIVLLI